MSFTSNNDNFEIPTIEMAPHLLISSVRQKYLSYLTKLLTENYVSWCQESPPDTLWATARLLELQAASEAMVVPIYRRSITTMINSLKKHTAENEIYPILRQCCVKSQSRSTQTDDQVIPKTVNSPENVTIMKNINGHNQINDIFAENGMFSETVFDLTQLIELSPDDEILKEMEELFGDQPVNLEEKTVQVANVDINKFNSTPTNMELEVSAYGNQHKNNPINQESSVISHSLDERLSRISNDNDNKKCYSSQTYFYSRWPCELYYQKKLLREALDRICEKSFKLHFKIKNRFVKVFGYDSDDEQALQSPNSSIDFVRSCRQRASRFLVRHLRMFFSKMRMQKHLFKPLARYLLYKLIEVNEYPDDYTVYLYVRQYFKNHPRIQCQADF